jgi:hypothetical protein
MNHPSLALASLALTLACQSNVPERRAEQNAAASADAAPGKRVFGTAPGTARQADLAAVLQAPNRFTEAPVMVEGHVRRACSKKGCWMELATSKEPGAPACRVTFKDYGFLVPTDSAGASARLEGVVTLRRVEPKLVSHLEAEGATFAAKAGDGSADEVRIVATGVELSRPET